MIGRSLAHYHITAAIGAGGMGEVYRASDSKLGRDVALKILPPDMAHDPDRLARFQREARSVAALNHPNIVTLFSVEHSDGTHFLTMELVEGQSLEGMIPKEGFAAGRIIEMASALADALAAAHDKGLVHRDLKPANIMITHDGRVKVLDFGLAKDTRATAPTEATQTSLGQTQMGVVMGTPSYMSPEQISGRPVDHRSDIFSLGVILHEMTTGRRPFQGSNSAELAASILRDSPPPITRTDLPGELKSLIQQCLAKDSADRIQSARLLAKGLQQARLQPSSSVEATRKVDTTTDDGFWVAVQPFKYKGSNADIEALGEGLSDEVLTGLSRFSYLRVIASGSPASHARYVIEGSLRQAGPNLRLAARLVDKTTGTHLWAETYDRPFRAEDILALQDDLVPRIVATIADQHGVLVHSIAESLEGKSDALLTPHGAVLRFFRYIERITPEEHVRVRALIERAVEQAPDHSDCWAAAGLVYAHEYAQGFSSQPDLLDRALSSARRAVELRPSSQFAHDSLAFTLFHRRETRAFRAAAERAIALNRMNATTTASMGLLIAYSGDWEAGCAIVERAAQLNPHHPGWYNFPAFFNAYLKGEYRTALDAALRNNMPGYFYTPAMRAAAYGQLGEYAPAQDCLRELLALKPDIAAIARREFAKWYQPELVDLFIDGLRKAGLEIEGSGAAAGPSPSGEARSDDGFWVAVLPFKATGASSEWGALADGLSEEIVTGLSRFSYLRVIARGSTLKYANQSPDIRTVGKELGARYVMEGSLRQAGPKLRLAVQLIDASTGAQIWAENYERTFTPEAIFELQDDLAPRIVSTIADMNGALPRSMSASVRGRGAGELSPYEAVIRSFGYFERVTPEELAAAQSGLDAALRKAPASGDAWAMLALLHVQDYAQGFGLQADALNLGADAARKAVAAAPSNHLAHFSLAQALFFQKEFPSFRNSAARAVELNPMDGNSLALLAEFYTNSGDPTRGLALAERAKQLNPNHPGWYWHTNFTHAYRQGDYQEALNFILKSDQADNWGRNALMAAAYGQLGDCEQASKAVRELLRLRPDVGKTIEREMEKWFDAEHGARLLEGLRKAGLEIGGAGAASTSGEARTHEGFWVAVLPFKSTGSSPELTALAEGLSEEIVTGLSRFSYLRVISRTSTLKYAKQAADIRTVGKELGARYMMEGNLRQAGAKLRIAVQLIDATTGAQLWAETYERTFNAEAIFELQDDLVPRIVSTIADNNGALPRSMSEAVHSKAPEELSPYEAVLRSFAYFERYTPEELSASRSGLEAAVRKAPAYADAWAMLACLCAQDYLHGYELQADALENAASAARKAVELSPASHLAYFSLAQVLAHQKDFDSFQDAAERVLALNPMDGNAVAFLGEFLVYGGNAERGMQLAERAKQLNPNHPGFYWFADFYHAFSQKDYRGALAFAQKAKLRGNPLAPMMIASAAGQLGDGETAAKAAGDLLKFRPELPPLMPSQVAKVWNPEYGERFLEGLRKAGLDIPAKQLLAPAKTTSGAVRSAACKTPSIAVLPFANMSADKDQEYFSDGLSEEIINLLAKIPGLKVIARTSAFAFRGKELDIRGIADALGVTHVLEGSVRRTETRLRVTGQLIDAADGAHLWSERYDREMSDIFALQDDIATAIAGALRVKLSPEAIRKRYEPKLEAYEAYLKAKYLQAKATPESLELAKQCHERAIKLDPAFALARAEVGFYWIAMTMFGRCPADKASLAACAEAERALQIDPALPDAHALSGYLSAVFEQDWAKAEQYFAFPGARQVGTSITRPLYGWFQYLRGNVAEAIALAQRAIEEDPLDVWSRMNLHAYLQAADREREALEQLRKVLELDPNQAVAMVSVAMILADQGNLHEALATARRARSIGLWLPETTGVLAALLYRSGDDAESQSVAKTLGSGGTPGDARAQALFHLLCGEVDKGADWVERAINEGDLAMRTVYIRFVACKQLRASHRWPKIAKMVNLPQAAETPVRNTSSQQHVRASHPAADSGATRADEGFWVAVLPLRSTGANAELAALADALTEEITTGLSRFSYLRVIARGSTLRYATHEVNVRTAGKELGASYIMEGTLRQASNRIRLAVQLVDASTGAQMWAETYERAFDPDAVFEIQDDLASRVVSTVADQDGVLPQSMAEVLRSKREDDLTPQEAMLRSLRYWKTFTSEEHALARRILERAVEVAPSRGDCHALLSHLYSVEYWDLLNPREGSLDRALVAAKRAVDVAPTNNLSYWALALALFFKRDRSGFRVAAQRAIELNRMDGSVVAFMGHLIAYSGEWDRGVAIAEKGSALNPHHGGWHGLLAVYDAYQRRDYQRALDAALRLDMRGHFQESASRAAAYAQLGHTAEAGAALRELLTQIPDFPVYGPEFYRKLLLPEMVDHVLDGLRKAGLEIGSASEARKESSGDPMNDPSQD